MIKPFPQNAYSNASRLFAMDITAADTEKGVIEARFQATSQFTNTVGNIQGGILTAMLDDLMGYALGITLPTNQFAPTANLNVSFLRSAQAGQLHGKGEILKQEGDLYYLAAKLYSETNDLLAAATAMARRGDIT